MINGKDDRVELYQLDSEDERAKLSGSAAALMYSHRIEFTGDASVSLRALSLGETFGLCETERFLEQPAAAHCSGTLIDDDLFLTAGHCLGETLEEAEERCSRLLVVFDYQLAPEGKLALTSGESVFACRRVALYRAESESDLLDVAVLQLDRTATPDRVPARIAADPPQTGDALLSATHGAGLPLKLDAGGSVLDLKVAEGRVVADTDSFSGGSGGGLYNASLELWGHQVRGQRDWSFGTDCTQPAEGDGKEEHQLARDSVDALCGSGWPSERLCGREAVCGDDHCSAKETTTDCPQDCAPPVCGDGLCEMSERESCATDCHAFDHVPASWESDPAEYVRQAAEEDAAIDQAHACSMGPPRSAPAGGQLFCLWAAGALAYRLRRRFHAG